MTVSFLEVYMERLTDLLAHDSDAPALAVREDPKTGVFVEGATTVVVRSTQQILAVIQEGVKRRATHATSMNLRSSRSHAVLRMNLRTVKPLGDGPAPDEEGLVDMEVKVHHAVLTMVDLAGSERVSKSGSVGMRLEEAKRINLSVAALGNCIAALADNSAGGAGPGHVPFRDSKLTRILTNGLGGNSNTVLCANVSASLADADETYSTLTLATRAKRVRTKPKKNEHTDVQPFVRPALPLPRDGSMPVTANEARLQAELAELRRLLAGTGVGHAIASSPGAKAACDAAAARARDGHPSPVAPQTLASHWKAGAGAGAGAGPGPGAGAGAAQDAAAAAAASREVRLTQRYTTITKRLQEEVAAQNVLIAQLQYALAQAQFRARTAEQRVLDVTGAHMQLEHDAGGVPSTPAAAVVHSAVSAPPPAPPTPTAYPAPAPMPRAPVPTAAPVLATPPAARRAAGPIAPAPHTKPVPKSAAKSAAKSTPTPAPTPIPTPTPTPTPTPRAMPGLAEARGRAMVAPVPHPDRRPPLVPLRQAPPAEPRDLKTAGAWTAAPTSCAQPAPTLPSQVVRQHGGAPAGAYLL